MSIRLTLRPVSLKLLVDLVSPAPFAITSSVLLRRRNPGRSIQRVCVCSQCSPRYDTDLTHLQPARVRNLLHVRRRRLRRLALDLHLGGSSYSSRRRRCVLGDLRLPARLQMAHEGGGRLAHLPEEDRLRSSRRVFPHELEIRQAGSRRLADLPWRPLLPRRRRAALRHLAHLPDPDQLVRQVYASASS